MKLWIIGELNIFVLIHVNRYPKKLMHPQFFVNVRVETPSALFRLFVKIFESGFQQLVNLVNLVYQFQLPDVHDDQVFIQLLVEIGHLLR